MADSVTPPSSPFGAPAPGSAPAEAGLARNPIVVPSAFAGESYGARFRLAYAGLAAVVAAALAVLALALLRGASPGAPSWSAWQPPGGARLDEAAAIASHVAPEYRLAPGGGELVVVQAHAPEVQNVSVEAVVVRGASGSSSDYKVTSAANTVSYSLCGLGTRCTIAAGTPTQARARLLRREALELALYTFKYVPGVDSVLALLPPPKNQNINWALFFRKSDFSAELSRPLTATLPPGGKAGLTPASVVGNSDQQVVEKLTRPYWYVSQFQQLQDGNAVIVLDPLIAGS